MRVSKTTPTLYDVATKSGVSTATVSRCLNFPDQVTERTRKKVMTAVNALGYSPNFGAKVMAARRTKTIGAIIPTMENAIFARGLQAFQEELRLHGYTMLVASSSYQADLEEEQIRALVARGADALLLIGHDRSPAIYDFLETQEVPTLVTWAFDRSQSRPSVGFDNRAAMRDLACEVIRHGHRKLALISAHMAQNDRARERVEGLRAAMLANGLAPDDLTVVQTQYDIDQGTAAFLDLMQTNTPPTAVFCGNDVIAVGALRGARELGLHVPQDVSIVGFDDMELAQITDPALTTVHVPHADMGKQSARVLVDLLAGRGPLQSIELHSEIKLRGSLGVAKET